MAEAPALRAGRPALLLTAFDRPHYLEKVLDSWSRVRGLAGWHVRFAVEPSDVTADVVALVEAFVARTGHADTEVVVNPSRLGVLENPYAHLGTLFSAGHGFVVRAEDDLLVADDVLELFAHAATAYADEEQVATVHAYSRAAAGGRADALVRAPQFCPWVFGTWRDRWESLIGPTWDRDYSTWNSSPGFETGFDWNLDTRVFPAHGLVSVSPEVSRVQNIGAVGVHGTPELLETARSFASHQRARAFREVVRHA